MTHMCLASAAGDRTKRATQCQPQGTAYAPGHCYSTVCTQARLQKLPLKALRGTCIHPLHSQSWQGLLYVQRLGSLKYWRLRSTPHLDLRL